MYRRIRKTVPTQDQDAQMFNKQFDDVSRYSQTGRELHDIFYGRFSGDEAEFNRWVRSNLDRSALTIKRYLSIYENIEMLQSAGVIRLRDAYILLGLTGSTSTRE